MDFPNEILLNIFGNLNPSNLDVVVHVCQKWRNIVQMIHNSAWKSVSRAVQLKRDIIGPLYKSRGWIEAQHAMDQCNCIKISMDLVTYDDLQLLNRDLELLKLHGDKFYEIDYLEFPELTDLQAFSRLSAAGVLTTIRNVLISDIQLPSIKHIGHFLCNVKESLEVSEGEPEQKDLANLFKWINCNQFTLSWHWDSLTNADIKSLTEVLNSRVDKFSYKFGGEPFLPYIEQYDGRGKCKEIELVYSVPDDEDDEDVDCLYDRDKLIDWSQVRGWTFSVDNLWPDNHSIYLKRSFHV